MSSSVIGIYTELLAANSMVYPDSIGYTVPNGCCDQALFLMYCFTTVIPEPSATDVFLYTPESTIWVLGLGPDDGSILSPLGGRVFDEGTLLTIDMSNAPGWSLGFSIQGIRYGQSLSNGFIPPLGFAPLL